MKAQTDIAAVIITDRQWLLLYFSGSYRSVVPILAIRLALPPIYSHNNTYMRRKDWGKMFLKHPSISSEDSCQLLKGYILMLFRKQQKAPICMWTSELQSHSKRNHCLHWLLFFRFHCVIANNRSMYLYELHCPHRLKSMTSVIRIGWTTLATDDGWGECGLLKGYISH